MSLQKLENYSNKSVVQEEVLILTELLEDITKNMLAPETFEKIIQLKELSTQEDYQGLNRLVTSLSNDEMVYISSYLSILPLLIIISEDVDLDYEINHQNNIDQDYLGKLYTKNKLVAEKE
ncbi:phosphoenolpyruvate carboxylase, partial [Streptococcus pneumoniae]